MNLHALHLHGLRAGHDVRCRRVRLAESGGGYECGESGKQHNVFRHFVSFYFAQRSTSGSSVRAIASKSCALASVHGLHGQSDAVGADHAALLHENLRGRESALPVLVVDERQPAGVCGRGILASPGRERVVDRADAVGIAAARHRARRAGLEIGQQRDAFLAVPRAFDELAGLRDQRRELVGHGRHLELEVAHIRGLPRDAREHVRR